MRSCEQHWQQLGFADYCTAVALSCSKECVRQRALLSTCVLSGGVAGGAGAGTVAGVGVPRTGFTSGGAWDMAERPRFTRETLRRVGHSWCNERSEKEKEKKYVICWLFCESSDRKRIQLLLFLTFYLNIFQKNRLDYFGPHHNATCPPVQDVSARF